MRNLLIHIFMFYSFRAWLTDTGNLSNRYIQDTISRIRRLERETKILLEAEYQKDKCNHLLSLLSECGKGLALIEHGGLPVYEKSMKSFSTAVQKYIAYRDYIDNSQYAFEYSSGKLSDFTIDQIEKGHPMNHNHFLDWLTNNTSGTKRYNQDTISRLRTFERETGIDLEQEYTKDCCSHVFSMFKNYGSGLASIEHGKLPIGNNRIINYSFAIRRFVKYMDAQRD